jgi:muconolactone delta-isomerase
MNITAVILTIKDGVDLAQLGEVLKHEQETVKVWKKQGIIHDIYLRQGRKGAVIMFPEMDEAAVQTLIETLPLYPYFQPAEFLGLLKND